MSSVQDEIVKKRSIKIRNHATSVSLEDAFWKALAELAREQGRALSALIEEVDSERKASNLSSCLRIYVLQKARQRYLAVARAGHSPKRAEDQPVPRRPRRDMFADRQARAFRRVKD